MARLKLKITPLLDKIFIYSSYCPFYNHGAGGPWCLASLANESQLWPRKTLLRRRMHGTVFQPDAFTPSLDNDTEFVAIGQVILRLYGKYFSTPSGCAAFDGYSINLWFSLLATRLLMPTPGIRQASGVPRPSAWTWRASSWQLANTPTRCTIL